MTPEEELEVYKKALQLACECIYYERCAHCIMNNGSMYDECDACSTPYDYIDRYLQKAREE